MECNAIVRQVVDHIAFVNTALQLVFQKAVLQIYGKSRLVLFSTFCNVARYIAYNYVMFSATCNLQQLICILQKVLPESCSYALSRYL